VAVRPVDVILLVALYVACGLGITVGFHRLFSHKAFATTPAVRGTLAVLGSMTVQGPVTQWVTDHRKHHALSDREGDPHSPHGGREGIFGGLAGFFHAHMGWLVTTKGMERGRRYGRDLYDDPLIRALDRLYMLWVVLSLGIPFAIGYAVDPTWQGGLTGMVWGGLVRIFLFHHMTWSVNSVCHTFGRRPYETEDESRNNWIVALPTFGEGWDNYHHAFPGSAIHGLGRRQVDASWWTMRGVERVGLAWDVKVPTPQRLARRAAQVSTSA
jgi:stearoyl-CoA desaturase (delta-9 desaturase)